ncbi:hypothetical protein [Pedobacter sp. Leaf194]|nr:hypothetical protein [Pedobacter sp. Leaf194]
MISGEGKTAGHTLRSGDALAVRHLKNIRLEITAHARILAIEVPL